MSGQKVIIWNLIKNGEDGIWKLQKKQYLKQVKNKVL